MIYNDVALEEKQKKIDAIEKNLELLREVLDINVKGAYKIERAKKEWIGGGSSIYKIISERNTFFLKVKSEAVTVESKLEEETNFITDSCLLHEKNMLEFARRNGARVPNIIFYENRNGFDFLATEYIPDELIEVLSCISIDEHIDLWNDLVDNVRILFNNDIVHMDLHEYNIRCKAGKVYLVDLEESRILKQNVEFCESLDYIGYNRISTLGKFPNYIEEEYSVPYNCLNRLKQVFDKYLASKVYSHIKLCNYDSCNGICTTLDHGHSEKTYQEIKNKYFMVGGQRNADTRIDIIKSIINKVFEDDKYTFVDVGSNNGMFGRKIASLKNKIVRNIGLEGFHNFNVLARGLAFMDDIQDIEYRDFVCGENSLSEIELKGKCIFTICSVWHHIKNKDKFVQQLKKVNIEAIFFEFAEQNDIYEKGSWQNELQYIKDELGFDGENLITYSNDYNRPLILISKKQVSQKKIDKIVYEINEKQKKIHTELCGEELLKEYLKGNKKKYIVCFGAGNLGKRAIDFLGAEKISFFIDNKKMDMFENHIVLTPEEAKKIINNRTLIAISTSNQHIEGISNQLNELGLNNYVSLDELLQKGLLMDEF